MAELRHGFKAKAERLAAEERAELDLGLLNPLDPWQLAVNHGVQVLALSGLSGLGAAVRPAVDHFSGAASSAFSALLLPVGVGAAIVENDAHAITRRRSNLSHEFGHLLLEHEFGHILFSDGCRLIDPTLEEEALWLGGELLIPREGALVCARNEESDHQVATRYEVSLEFARMRMNRSGVRIQADRERNAKRRRIM